MQNPRISEDSDTVRRNRSEKSKLKHYYSSEDYANRYLKDEKCRCKHSSSHGYEDSNFDAEYRGRHRHYH